MRFPDPDTGFSCLADEPGGFLALVIFAPFDVYPQEPHGGDDDHCPDGDQEISVLPRVNVLAVCLDRVGVGVGILATVFLDATADPRRAARDVRELNGHEVAFSWSRWEPLGHSSTELLERRNFWTTMAEACEVLVRLLHEEHVAWVVLASSVPRWKDMLVETSHHKTHVRFRDTVQVLERVSMEGPVISPR